jgi:NADH-quinone oxidoreductase E subunit
MSNKPSLEEIFSQFPNRQREDLIPLLQAMHDAYGFISEPLIKELSDYLQISINKIYGVATFYDNFRFGPVGRFHVQICCGTACHVAGSSTILQEIEKQLRIKDGETDKQGLFSLEVVSCIGACGLAPLIVINEEYYTRMTGEKLTDLLNKLQNNENLIDV